MDAVSAKEELFQRRDENCVSRAVVLTCQGTVLDIGEDVYQRLSPVSRALHETLHLFQQFCKTIIGLIQSFFHATLEHAIAVSD